MGFCVSCECNGLSVQIIRVFANERNDLVVTIVFFYVHLSPNAIFFMVIIEDVSASFPVNSVYCLVILFESSLISYWTNISTN